MVYLPKKLLIQTTQEENVKCIETGDDSENMCSKYGTYVGNYNGFSAEVNVNGVITRFSLGNIEFI